MAASDDEVEIVEQRGFDALRSAPHARSDCLNFKWASTPHAKHCSVCYCYVCDDLTSKCRSWTSCCTVVGCADTSSNCQSHCHASSEKPRWVAARSNARRSAQSAELQRARQAEAAAAAASARDQAAAQRPPAAAAPPPQAGGRASGAVDGEAVAAEQEETEQLFSTYTPSSFNRGDAHPDPARASPALPAARRLHLGGDCPLPATPPASAAHPLSLLCPGGGDNVPRLCRPASLRGRRRGAAAGHQRVGNPAQYTLRPPARGDRIRVQAP